MDHQILTNRLTTIRGLAAHIPKDFRAGAQIAELVGVLLTEVNLTGPDEPTLPRPLPMTRPRRPTGDSDLAAFFLSLPAGSAVIVELPGPGILDRPES